MNIVLFRLILTFILAFIFGVERQKSHKPVGFGTFIFVAIGSCALALIALDLGNEEPLGLLSAIVTGIGFLGAGALIKNSDRIFGFTTAASIWLFAIIGLVIGTGHYEIAIILYSFVWISILTDKYLEKYQINSYQKKLGIKINDLSKEQEIIKLFDKYKIRKYKLLSKKIDKKENLLSLSYLFEGSGKDIRKIIEILQKKPYFREFALE